MTATVERGWRSGVAVAAAILAAFGAMGLTWAVFATSPLSGYVSEAGVPGAPQSLLYRGSILAVAASMGLLAYALRFDGAYVLLSPAALLGTAAPLAALSGAVPCSSGCPLPPYETPTTGDLVHATASALALAFAALAMLLLAARPAAGHQHVVAASRIGAIVTVPLLALAGLAMLSIGRGLVTGVIERAALLAALSWLVTVALLVHQNGRRDRSPAGGGAGPADRGERPADLVRRTEPTARGR